MDKIWRVLVEFRDEVSYTIKDIDSAEADQYNQIGSFLVINERTVLGRNFSEVSLRRTIEQALQI